jgi:hypothetical protein
MVGPDKAKERTPWLGFNRVGGGLRVVDVHAVEVERAVALCGQRAYRTGAVPGVCSARPAAEE